jgi:(p)ppGpp synthase/HD superfamily hydrolase
MFAAKVNGAPVHAGHALANAEVVEVLTYDGAPSRGSLLRHQEWTAYARTKTARHKLAKFLKDHAELLCEDGAAADAPSQQQQQLGSASEEAPQVLNLTIQCADRPGLLAEIAQIIADYGHNIKVPCCCVPSS